MNLISGDHRAPWLTHLPVRWDNKPLKYVATINRMALPESTPADQLIRYIDISSVNSLGQVVNIESMAFRSAPSRARRVARHGDTIVSTVRTYLRAVASIPEDDSDLVASTGFAVVTPGPDLHAGFLSHWLRGNLFVDEVCARSVGVSYPATNASELGCIPVPLPPLPTQKAIADFLDKKTAAIDALIEKKQTLLTLLIEKQVALIRRAVTRGLDPSAELRDSRVPGLGAIPKHWTVVPARYAVRISNSSRLPLSRVERAEMHGDFPYWGPTGVLDHINEWRYQGDFALIGEDGDHFLKFNRWAMTQWPTGRFNVNNHAHVVASGAECSARWFYYAMRHRDIGGSLVVQGVSRRKLTRWRLSDLPIQVPPMAEQDTIIRHLDSTGKKEAGAERGLRAQIERLQEYRQALITAAVTGQLDIGEAA